MAIASFEQLCAGFCEIARISPPALAPDEFGRISFHVKVRGAVVDIAHCSRTSPEHVFLIHEIAPAVEVSPAGLQVLLAANFKLQLDAPVFCHNPATGAATLMQALSLFDATAVGLHEMVSGGIELASNWRHRLATGDAALESSPASTPQTFAHLNLA
jgi:hypothetical protein